MKRDFSEESKTQLLKLVSDVENEKWCDFTDWWGDRWYDFDSWIGQLNIKNYIDDVNGYHKKVIDKNNTSKTDINKIFEAVKNVDTSYAVRVASSKTQLEMIQGLIDSLANTISPEHGTFDSADITSNLANAFSAYEQSSKLLEKLSEDGLTEKDLEGLSDDLKSNLMSKVISSVVDVLPNINVGEELEIPIGPGLVVYYSVETDIDAGSDIDIKTVIEDQKFKFKTIGSSIDAGNNVTIEAEVGAGDEGSLSVGNDQNKVEFNVDGSIGSSSSFTIGDTTYTYKTEFGVNKIAFEESVSTEFESGSMKSTIGIKQSNQSNWVPVPVYVPETVPVSMPQLSMPDVDWENVIIVGTVIFVAAGIVLAVPTGGSSLALCFI